MVVNYKKINSNNINIIKSSCENSENIINEMIKILNNYERKNNLRVEKEKEKGMEKKCLM